MFSKEELKAAEKQAIEGLVGAARAAAKKAFYEANKAAIRAANNAEAVSKEEARTAPERALAAAAAAHHIDWRWVRGHSGHPENERVDQAARAAAEALHA